MNLVKRFISTILSLSFFGPGVSAAGFALNYEEFLPKSNDFGTEVFYCAEKSGELTDYLSTKRLWLRMLELRLKNDYEKFKSYGLNLDMSRGKPCKEQINLSKDMLDIITSESDCKAANGVDCCNYGVVDGIPEAKKLFSDILGMSSESIIVGGNSSLNMMFDTISCFMFSGVNENDPWIKQGKIKFLCPSPGYDRHFAILEYFNIEPVVVPMTKTGPDMDMIEHFVSTDEKVKGIWCVPKYSNPQGITYSDETVRRLAALKPKASDFKIFWDNAYAIHDIRDEGENLLNIMEESKKYNNENLPIIFCSTSKITFPGAGVAALGASGSNLEILRKKYSIQTIGYDKLNQLRHVKFLKDFNNILGHMEKHRKILEPKFDVVLGHLQKEFAESKLVTWNEPKGGYFVSVNVVNGCAKRVVSLCKEAGLVLTPAGATYPKGHDYDDSNIRIAPSYPSISELDMAMQLFCLCVKLAMVEKELET
ncbi:MAG: putative aminotransferase [Eubacteriales bacterium SKADARSKE-1]|nr:putative aminotransferase [Eubacteriales bacterium SKADARSKE-1]